MNTHSFLGGLCLAGLGALLCAPASAQIKQPNGTAIPVTDNFRLPLNGEPVCYPAGSCTPTVRTQQLTSNPNTYVNENITTITASRSGTCTALHIHSRNAPEAPKTEPRA
jgi:hypothetical protein